MGMFIKKPTIVEAIQAQSEKDLGTLGLLVTEDWIIQGWNGSMITMDNDTFLAKYVPASAGSTLTGDDLA